MLKLPSINLGRYCAKLDQNAKQSQQPELWNWLSGESGVIKLFNLLALVTGQFLDIYKANIPSELLGTSAFLFHYSKNLKFSIMLTL